MSDHIDCLVGIVVRVRLGRSESQQRFPGFCNLSFPDQPPWRFGGKEDSDDERRVPHPLFMSAGILDWKSDIP
jgi:hypothetical protein